MTFPTPSPADWKTLAEKALKDKPLENLVHLDADNLVVRPLYAGITAVETVFAPRPSDAEGRAWDLRTLVEGDDPAAVTPALVRALVDAGAAIVTVRERATTLEQVYFEVMGVRPDRDEAS